MKITKTKLRQIIKEEASKILNEVITVRDIERMLPSGVMAEYPGAARILLKRALAAKMSREELVQKIKAARIKDGEHPRQFFRRLGFEYDLKEEKIEESSGSLSNIYKLCPPNTECKPESQKTNWWGSRGNLNEELTRQDKTDVKKMVQDELEKLLKKKDTKDQMGEIVKKIMKKLYKDLSLEHPYIIDRIKIQGYIKKVNDPFAAQHPQAQVGDWVHYASETSERKLTGLVIEVDQKTNFMRVHCFETMKIRWLIRNNVGQYKVL